MSAPTTDRNGCVHYPAIAAVPLTRYTRTETPTNAWDAGANSVLQLGGDVRLEFSEVARPLGSVIGLTIERENVINPARMAFAWYLSVDDYGQGQAWCYEHGMITSAPYFYDENTRFAIERRGKTIFYWLGEQMRRRTPSTLAADVPVSVGAALYGGYDSLPST